MRRSGSTESCISTPSDPKIGERLRDSLRPSDQLFRFGGDEFIVLLHDLTCSGDAERVSQRILDNLHQPLHVDDRTLVAPCSLFF